MKEKDWKPIIIADAMKKGVCDEYAELMRRSKSVTDFVRLYRRGIDWSLENDCPSLKLLRQLSEERLDLHGIYIDQHFDGDILDDRQVYIFHHCSGTIRTGLNLQRKIIPMLYFANGCDMTVESSNEWASISPVRVPLYLFGANKVICETTPKIAGVFLNKEVK